MIENDQLQTVDSLNAVPPYFWSNSLKFDSASRVVVTTANPVSSWSNGLPFDSEGNLCVSIA